MYSSLENRNGTFLPKELFLSHELCFLLHDLLVTLLKTGEEGSFFKAKVDVHDDIKINDLDDIFEYLETSNRHKDKALILKTTVLPALLSDILHCVYETLENSRKGKLNMSYMLIRKPLQENLYLLESILLDDIDFSSKLTQNPQSLGSQNAGGVEGHNNRIDKVLKSFDESFGMNSQYIAQLRYDKKSSDSFDGICNKAMHLFTSHKYLATEKLNINFIFSSEESKLSQWNFIYSRLPYLLFYTYKVVISIMSSIVETFDVYENDMQRRISSLVILWWNNIDSEYRTEELEKFTKINLEWLNSHCIENKFPIPNIENLELMCKNGAFPSESEESVKDRNILYEEIAKSNREYKEVY